MELCTTRGISNLLLHKPPVRFAPNHIRTEFHCRSRFPVILKQIGFKYGSYYHTFTCLSSTTVATTYDAVATEKAAPESIKTEEFSPEAAGGEDIPSEESKTESTTPEATSYTNDEPEPVVTVKAEEPGSGDDPLQLPKFLEDLNIKFDYGDKYSYITFGGGALLSLWISAAVVRAIDSILLLPKVLELVGLGYTIWFITRYLIFKESRKELVALIKEFKEEVFGSEED